MATMIVTIAFAASIIEHSSLSTRLVFRSSIRIRITGITRTITTVTTVQDIAMETQLWRCSADLLAPGTITVPLMGSWGLKRDEQFALTNATTTCPPTDD